MRDFSIDVNSWIVVKWVKGIYLIDKTIKGFESQEKSPIKNVSESINFCLVRNKDEPIYFGCFSIQETIGDRFYAIMLRLSF